jgi:hypothetical protein
MTVNREDGSPNPQVSHMIFVLQTIAFQNVTPVFGDEFLYM